MCTMARAISVKMEPDTGPRHSLLQAAALLLDALEAALKVFQEQGASIPLSAFPLCAAPHAHCVSESSSE